MKYNDNDITKATNLHLMQTAYKQEEQSKSQDLVELYEKMLAERQYIHDNNSDHHLDNILETTDRHISMLKSILPTNIIHTTAELSPISRPHFRPFINNGGTPPNNSPLPNTNNNIPNIDNDIPTPPLSPNNNTNRPINNSQPNSPIDNQPQQSNQTPRRNRNSPLQSGFLSTLAKSIFGRKIRSQNIVEDKYRNRFHNMFISNANIQNHCDPCRKMVTNECNILRLILLYITLHPHCCHTHTLSTIAEERVQILAEIA